jgi:fructan beta-fructosidase
MTNILSKVAFTILVLIATLLPALSAEISIKITKRYLNLPVSQKQDGGTMVFNIDGKQERSFKIRLAVDQYHQWCFLLSGKHRWNGCDGRYLCR